MLKRGVLLCYALPWLAAAQPITNQFARFDEQIAQTRTLIAETTNTTEKAYWQQRLELLQQDRRNLERRCALDEKERVLTAHQQKQSGARLRELLRVIGTDTHTPSNELTRAENALRMVQLQRAGAEQARRDLAQANQPDSEQVADLDQQLRLLDEEASARIAEREMAEARWRLVTEANRIDELLRTSAINPQVTIRLLREQGQRLTVAHKGRRDAADLAELNRQRREGIAAALTLAQEKMAHLEAEQALVSKKNQGVKGWFKTLPLYFSGGAEKKYLARRVMAQQQQLAAVDTTINLTMQQRDLLEQEVGYLQDERAHLRVRFEQRLLLPVGSLLVLLIGYLLFSRLLVPRWLVRDRQVVGRRLAGYLCIFIGLVVTVTFFFEDLRSVATILGIASAAVVIALQDMCSAFAGWFVIMSGRKFAVGHRVEIDGQRGDVIDIQLLRTTLLEVDCWLGVDEPTGRIIVVPNSFVFRSKFFNYTYLHPYVWNKLDITVTYETPASEAQALLLRVLEEETREEFAAARAASRAMEHRYGVPDATYQPKIFSYIADSGVQFRLLFVAHYRRVSSTRTRINARIIREFGQDPRLQFAYPTQRHIPTPEHGALRVTLEKTHAAPAPGQGALPC
jgi:small-conductance mechanosensitive channel